MNDTDVFQENQKIFEARHALKAYLQPGETLLQLAYGYYFQPGNVLQWECCLGLTERRILVLNQKKPDRVYSVYHELIKNIQRRMGFRFQIQMNHTSLIFGIKPEWREWFDEIIRKQRELPPATAPLEPDQALQQARDLIAFRHPSEARDWLQKNRHTISGAQDGVEAPKLLKQIREDRLAISASVILFAIMVLISLPVYYPFFHGIFPETRAPGFGKFFLTLILQSLIIVTFVLEGIQFYYARQGARLFAPTGLVLALTTLAYFLIEKNFSGAILWAAAAVTFALLVFGKPGRTRTATAIAIFGVGFLGLFTAGLIGRAYSPISLQNLLDMNAISAFSDGFSTRKGWKVKVEGQGAAWVEQGGYHVLIAPADRPNSRLFTYPPANVHPDDLEVQVSIPEEDGTNRVAFGIACHYRYYLSNKEATYTAIISPGIPTYDIILTDWSWRLPRTLIDPLKKQELNWLLNGASNPVRVSCGNGEMKLWVNEVLQDTVRDPGLIPFYLENMAIWVQTQGPQADSPAIELVFDDVKASTAK